MGSDLPVVGVGEGESEVDDSPLPSTIRLSVLKAQPKEREKISTPWMTNGLFILMRHNKLNFVQNAQPLNVRYGNREGIITSKMLLTTPETSHVLKCCRTSKRLATENECYQEDCCANRSLRWQLRYSGRSRYLHILNRADYFSWKSKSPLIITVQTSIRTSFLRFISIKICAHFTEHLANDTIHLPSWSVLSPDVSPIQHL